MKRKREPYDCLSSIPMSLIATLTARAGRHPHECGKF